MWEDIAGVKETGSPRQAAKIVVAGIAGAVLAGYVGSQFGIAGGFGALSATVPFALLGMLIGVLAVLALR